jgi:hypothetical protein
MRGRITALDRESNTITVSGDMTADEAPSHVRIYNSGRSSIYSVLETQPAGDGALMLRLRETSLLGRGVPAGYHDGRIDNDVCLPFATGRVDEAGNLHDFPCRFAGARVENADGSASLLLRGIDGAGWITGESGYNLYIDGSVAAGELQRLFGAPDLRVRFSVHDYGVGDNCEIIGSRDL